MNWKDVSKIISKTAPMIGKIISNPAGAAMEGVIGLVTNTLGISNPNPSPELIADAIIKNPDAGLKLKELELEHKTELQKLSLELDKIYIKDKQSARDREIAITQATGKKDYNLYAIAWIIILGFYILLGFLMFRKLPTGSNEVIFMLFGSLSTGFGTVLAYFFGSSKSSSDKTKIMGGK